MGALGAVALLWLVLRGLRASPTRHRGTSPARELYLRRLRDAGWR